MERGFLTTVPYRERLFAALRASSNTICIGSAYITVAGIQSILGCVPTAVKCGRVLVRWDARDLICGASDIEVYEAVSSRGFELYINQELHAKFVLIDDNELFIGSSNLTSSGLRLEKHGNWEGGTVVLSNYLDRLLISDLIAASVLVTPSLYAELREFVQSKREQMEPNGAVFPAPIASQLLRSIDGLWVRELIWTSGPEEMRTEEPSALHDKDLMSITKGNEVQLERLGNYFSQTRCCKWLIAKLEAHNGQLYFGEATRLLHDALLEDPKPYRKDVKTLLQNLFNWAAVTMPTVFIVDTPNHSQRISVNAEAKFYL